MIPLSVVMRKEIKHTGPDIPQRGKALHYDAADRRKWYGIIPLCAQCQHSCKQANAPGLCLFECHTFIRKSLTTS